MTERERKAALVATDGDGRPEERERAAIEMRGLYPDMREDCLNVVLYEIAKRVAHATGGANLMPSMGEICLDNAFGFVARHTPTPRGKYFKGRVNEIIDSGIECLGLGGIVQQANLICDVAMRDAIERKEETE